MLAYLTRQWTVTENLPFERFCFLKLSEFKQWKSFVRIVRNFIHIQVLYGLYNLGFKKWLLNFALSKARAGKVKEVNN